MITLASMILIVGILNAVGFLYLASEINYLKAKVNFIRDHQLRTSDVETLTKELEVRKESQ